MRRLCSALVLGALALTSAVVALAGEDPTPSFKIYVTAPGVYRVAYEELAAELGGAALATEALGLRNRGEPVPIWIEGGDDGSFDPGDRLEFIGRHLPGERQYFNEYTAQNVYVLDFADPEPLRMTMVPQSPFKLKEVGVGDRWATHHHWERDRLLTRFAAADGERSELWYWVRLSQLDAKPFRHTLRLARPRLGKHDTLSLRLHFRGLSQPRDKPDESMSDHRVEVRWNGWPVGSGEWNGQSDYLLEIPPIPAHLVKPVENEITLTVPRRPLTQEPDADPLIDVVLLNFIEVDYRRYGTVSERPARLRLTGDRQPARILKQGPPDLVVYGEDGSRISSVEMPVRRPTENGTAFWFWPPAGGASGENWMVVVPQDSLRAPDAIELDRPSALRAASNRADYIIITHPSLRAAIEPLAEMHRKRGLVVSVVEIDDVYDEFNHGILHPRAIRDFLGHAYRTWQTPSPRLVLLVGDASWDPRNEKADERNYASWRWKPEHGVRLSRQRVTPYSDGGDANTRNLIPAWSISSFDGHAASDNWFVAVEGDDRNPEMAIGRLPVVDPAEVRAIVDKTISYIQDPEVGPWRRNLLWITNEQSNFQEGSEKIEGNFDQIGFRSTKVYPRIDSETNAEHQQRLHRAFDDGQLLVHFYGHGGRFIWRTSKPDLRNQQDLFTLDDLDRLAPNRRLPVVLSMTCYSGPFDHPNADSLGEKFLRLPDRGAIAVLAASWRNGPSYALSKNLVAELISTETIGEGIMNAKRRMGTPPTVEIYNLFGDPAIPLAIPSLAVRLNRNGEPRELGISGLIEQPGFSGQALVEWLAADGSVLASATTDVANAHFEAVPDSASEPLDGVDAVRAYVWNAEQRIDGMSLLSFAATSGGAAPGR